MENQKATLQNRKKQEAKQMGKKRNVKKGKKWVNIGLVHLHFCCFFFAFSICFFLLLFFFFGIFRDFFQVLKNKNKLWFGEHKTNQSIVLLVISHE